MTFLFLVRFFRSSGGLKSSLNLWLLLVRASWYGCKVSSNAFLSDDIVDNRRLMASGMLRKIKGGRSLRELTYWIVLPGFL